MARRKKGTPEPSPELTVEDQVNMAKIDEAVSDYLDEEADEVLGVSQDDAGVKAPELAPPEPEPEEPLIKPDAREVFEDLFGGLPSADDIVELAGIDAITGTAIHNVLQRAVGEVRSLLEPGLDPETSVQVSSTAERGHYRCGRKFVVKPSLFTPDDPFLDEKTIKALEEDPRIRIKFPE